MSTFRHISAHWGNPNECNGDRYSTRLGCRNLIISRLSKNGEIPDDNGAPLSIAAPIKLGYKQSKWVIKVSFSSQIPKKSKVYGEE